MLELGHLYRHLSDLPPVPSRFPIYKGQLETTTDETTTTWTDVDIGQPHPQRLIILSCFHGVAASVSGTVNGYKVTRLIQGSSGFFNAIITFLVPTGLTATVTVTANSSIHKGVGVYVAYPKNPIPIDFGVATAGGVSDATVSNIKVQKDGFLIWTGAQLSVVGSLSATWNGADTATEDYESQIEVTSTYCNGQINAISVSSDNDDMTLAETAGGTKHLHVASWGPWY